MNGNSVKLKKDNNIFGSKTFKNEPKWIKFWIQRTIASKGFGPKGTSWGKRGGKRIGKGCSDLWG